MRSKNVTTKYSIFLLSTFICSTSCYNKLNSDSITSKFQDTVLIRFADFKVVLSDLIIYNEPDNTNPDTIFLYPEASLLCTDKLLKITAYDSNLVVNISYTQTNELLQVLNDDSGIETQYKLICTITSTSKIAERKNKAYIIKINNDFSTKRFNDIIRSYTDSSQSNSHFETFVSKLLIQIESKDKELKKTNYKYIQLVNQIDS